jgi:hypothetical protein
MVADKLASIPVVWLLKIRNPPTLENGVKSWRLSTTPWLGMRYVLSNLDSSFVRADIQMINSMYHSSSSTEDLCLPLPHDHTLAQGISLTPRRFMKEVLEDCHKHVKPADCDSSRAEIEFDGEGKTGLVAGGI